MTSLGIFVLLVAAESRSETFHVPELGWTAKSVKAATFDFVIEEEELEVSVDSFYIQPTWVTRHQYQLFLEENPEAATPEYWDFYESQPDHPVVGVNIRHILPFHRWLSSKDPDHTYRLPTEAELQAARDQKILDTEGFAVGDFTLDYFSESFADWDFDRVPIQNPFGPILPLHGPQPAPNLVGVYPGGSHSINRGPIAPDYTGTKFGFRYAFSPAGPGPLGARIMQQTAQAPESEEDIEFESTESSALGRMPESEIVEIEDRPDLPPTATPSPPSIPAPPTIPPTTPTHTPTPTMTETFTFTPTEPTTEFLAPLPTEATTESPAPMLEETVPPGPVSATSGYEVPPVFLPDQILPEELARGRGFRVTDQVATEGMFYSFSLWTDYGWWRPQSLALLRIRISEVLALNTLSELQKDPLFLEGVADPARQVSEPENYANRETAEGQSPIPLGLEKFAGGGVGARSEREGVEARFGYPTRAKTELAIRLGVDPYSDNQPLQESLESVASNRNVDLLTEKIDSLFNPGGVGLALSAAQVNKSIQQLLVEESRSEIRRRNATHLIELECDHALIASFLDHPMYTPTSQSIIVDSMTSLADVVHIERILDAIMSAPIPEVAHFHQTQLQMASAYHSKVDRLKELNLLETTPVFFNAEEKLVVFLPVDFLYWNERIETGMEALKSSVGVDGGQLWITGRVTDTAKERLLENGIDVYDRALYKLWGN